jgi:hypothetical protein
VRLLPVLRPFVRPSVLSVSGHLSPAVLSEAGLLESILAPVRPPLAARTAQRD